MKNLLLSTLSAAVLLGSSQISLATECLAPSGPGGGWDFTCRSIGKLLTDLDQVDGNVRVVNMAGGTGAVGFAYVANKRADDPELIVATSTVAINQIAQAKYPGDLETMRFVGMLGADVGVIAVAADSPIKNLDDLFAKLKEDPKSLVGAGDGFGSWDHIRYLLAAQSGGVEELWRIMWVQFDGGAPAITQMMGGRVDVVTTDLSEAAGFVESGDIRILAALSDESLPAFPDVPTAKSLGYDVTGYNWRGLYVGGDVSDEAYDTWVTRLKTVYDSDGWKDAATKNGLVPIWRAGDEFEAYLEQQLKDVTEIVNNIDLQ
ncbi:MAG: tripartite tricarboxylate transporter substrate binding protein [Roseibium sp.]|uniref:Bug family tripartite tricarboxylate transporter substrate binding protein n=1 Tax=Roseibium sp. TaxID=1936156 RepID=UPI001B2CD277|nr:tripartite tricarboxylate transporter substrate-binding protein [Roseibium sp.]MBO6893829.1 tripartite tricarboxylate transporter substrate binding protein [Roseibium sp.]MBO6931143.1 tripartite tricarboxylate transporter substrate binding protein [Roseibium sp.]